MSQPTRYDAADLRCKKCQKNVEVLGVLRSHDEGRFVMWEDYAALKAENEGLRNAVDAIKLLHTFGQNLNEAMDNAKANAAKEVQS